MKKICFISHDASRTGAPIVLYNLLKWMKAHTHNSFEVWFLSGGEMLDDFKAICPCKVLKQRPLNRWTRFFQKIIVKILKRNIFLKSQLKGLSTFDVIFFNTIVSLRLLPLIDKKRRSHLICYMHEQEYMVKVHFKHLLELPETHLIDRFFVVSSYIRDYLIANKIVSNDRITIVPPFIDSKQLLASFKTQNKESHKEFFTIGGCGPQLWLKGSDTFLAVAAAMKNNYPEIPVEFLWVGGESDMTNGITYETKKYGIENIVKFLGYTDNVMNYFQKFDLFLLTSREESFSLVVLEVAALHKPVLCFNGIGIITEFVGKIPGNVIDYNDAGAMAARIAYYYQNQEQIGLHGDILASQIADYDVEKGAKFLYEKLELGVN